METINSIDADIVVLGESGVGKTSLVRATTQGFQKQDTTIGVEFSSFTLHLPTDTTGKTRSVRLKMWDTAGQERFRSLVDGYYKKRAAALIVYDISKRSSFLACRYWLEELRKKCLNEDIVVGLVGNKTDRDARRQISFEEAQEWAESEGLFFLETSVLRTENNILPFEMIARRLLKKFPIDSKFGMQVFDGVEIRNTPHHLENQWFWSCPGCSIQ